jgi:hypothetical protein
VKHEHRFSSINYNTHHLPNYNSIKTSFFNGNNIVRHNYNFLPFFYIHDVKAYKKNILTNSYLIEYKSSIYEMPRAYRFKRYFSVPATSKLNFNSLDIFFEYQKLRKSSFTTFFNDYSVDTPICFGGSNSIKRRNFEFPILKFTNFLMNQGKREKVFISFLDAFHVISDNIRKNSFFFNTD